MDIEIGFDDLRDSGELRGFLGKAAHVWDCLHASTGLTAEF